MFLRWISVALVFEHIQSGVDLFMWGRPFAEISEYVRYNFANAVVRGLGHRFNKQPRVVPLRINPMSEQESIRRRM